MILTVCANKGTMDFKGENMDKKELKIQALKERLGTLVTSYENQIADLRVEVTVLTSELDEYKKRERENVQKEEG